MAESNSFFLLTKVKTISAIGVFILSFALFFRELTSMKVTFTASQTQSYLPDMMGISVAFVIISGLYLIIATIYTTSINDDAFIQKKNIAARSAGVIAFLFTTIPFAGFVAMGLGMRPTNPPIGEVIYSYGMLFAIGIAAALVVSYLVKIIFFNKNPIEAQK